MIEAEIFEQLTNSIKSNRPVALVTVISHAGSTPGKEGSLMVVHKSGESYGSVGGGDLEYTIIKQAISCIDENISSEYDYTLDKTGEIDMACGGSVRIYIKVFPESQKLVIVGAGHIGSQLYKLALTQNFSVTVIDHREEFANRTRYPEATEVIVQDTSSALSEMQINENTYIAIATHSHECDEASLRAAIDSDAAYIGMIGSRKKVAGIKSRLEKDNIKTDSENLFTPMGLDIASVKPEEIALSIMSEILLVKNSGTLRHMRNK
ncbi:MAG: xanthine dehydrogenase [Denitrovibrio sp.]|nr:MAG: xanthine dehydrogenase [Denitrovibrio sp.]